MRFIKDDGGRAAAGFKGKTGDCVTRAVAIATGLSYTEIYHDMARLNAKMPKTRGRLNGKGAVGQYTAARGIYCKSKLFKDYMADRGFTWVPTMQIGSGCRVHMRPHELPKGRLVVMLSKHAAAVIDGVLHDDYDCSRFGTRCVYGFYRLDGAAVGGQRARGS